MPTPHDYVTGGEFARWMTEEAEFRARLERRMEVNALAVQTGLGEIKTHLAEINGRTRRNSEDIAVIQRELQAIESEDVAIEKTVAEIQAHGCGQLAAHETVLRNLGWTPQKKAAVAGGLLGTGALMWPAIQEIAAALHVALEKWPR